MERGMSAARQEMMHSLFAGVGGAAAAQDGAGPADYLCVGRVSMCLGVQAPFVDLRRLGWGKTRGLGFESTPQVIIEDSKTYREHDGAAEAKGGACSAGGVSTPSLCRNLLRGRACTTGIW